MLCTTGMMPYSSYFPYDVRVKKSEFYFDLPVGNLVNYLVGKNLCIRQSLDIVMSLCVMRWSIFVLFRQA